MGNPQIDGPAKDYGHPQKPGGPTKPPGGWPGHPKPPTGVMIMATFTVKTTSSGPQCDLDFSIDIPDVAGREYTTVVNAGIAAVIAKAGAILVEAENDGNPSQALAKGMAMVNAIGS